MLWHEVNCITLKPSVGRTVNGTVPGNLQQKQIQRKGLVTFCTTQNTNIQKIAFKDNDFRPLHFKILFAEVL